MVQRLDTQAKVTGNRIASRINFEIKNNGLLEQDMVRLSAPYMADTLDQVEIYDQRLVRIFSRFIPTHDKDKEDTFQSSYAYEVIKEQFSKIYYEQGTKHMIGYFPIELPLEEGDILSKKTGVLHLVFDITQEYM